MHDVFQKGLVRGANRMPFDPEKRYFYVEHPTEGWRVYLRAGCFIHEKPKGGEPIDSMRFAVVKRAHKSRNGKEWEPPKGQMEGKDALKHPRTHLEELIKQNVRREVEEEAHVNVLHGLQHTGIVYQNVEPDFPPNTFFQYHVFQAAAPPKAIQRGLNWFAWLKLHPRYFARMKRDKKEKDELRWFDPAETKMMGRWSPSIVAMYVQAFT